MGLVICWSAVTGLSVLKMKTAINTVSDLPQWEVTTIQVMGWFLVVCLVVFLLARDVVLYNTKGGG